ncbi:MAG: hypothetical protein IJ529_01125 [Alphaproteobacteria bacterium]|nr:hypothetical protein [Alphaproteobacteria bacterium]MBQ9234895.1 hypothetical protein [Alphaproteobacteria bacterium]
MINSLYIFLFLVLIGAVLFNMRICHYFNQQMQALRWSFRKQRCFNILSTALCATPIILLLPFLFGYNDIWFVCSALSFLAILSVLSYCDYQIFMQNGKYNVWWNKITYFDKTISCIIIALSICLLYFYLSLRNISIIIGINSFFVYILFLKKIKEQHKILQLFTNKFIWYLEAIISNLFYYISWLVIGIYILSTSINIISSFFDPYDTDGCMDTGICKEGFTFNDCGDGKSCTITKESCLKNNNIWIEDIRSCDTRHTSR